MAADIAVQRTIRVGEAPAQARERFLHEFTGWMSMGGHAIAAPSPNAVSYINRRFNTWQIVVAFVLFPIGLIALLAEKKESRLDVLFSDEGAGSTAIMLTGSIHGEAAGPLADKLDAFDPSMASSQ